MMTKIELLEILEDIEDDEDIVLVSQPDRHPLKYYLEDAIEYEGKLYLVEGIQIGYLESEISQLITN